MNRQKSFALALALMMSVAVANGQTQIKSGFNLFSAEQDVEIGRQSAAEAERQLPILNDREVEAYVNNIGRKLAANAGGPKFPYTFKVVNASDINAFALPGGPIYLNRGIIDNARNEGEVAGVLAHEIAHVALRHGTHQASKAYGAQAGISILGGLLGGRVGNNTAQILNVLGGVGLNALFLKFSRELETQADVRGAQILAASGYSPTDMISFFNQLAKVDSSKKTTWMSHHPAPPDRQARIQKEAQLLRVTSNPTQNVAQLNRVKTQMARYGAAPTTAQIAQGTARSTTPTTANRTQTSSAGSSVLQGVEAPSSSMRAYTSRSGIYKVNHPSNWRVYEEGTTGVTIAPEGGIGNVGGKTEVVYGAIVNHYDPFGAATSSRSTRFGLRTGRTNDVYSSSITLRDASNDLVAQIRNTSPHLSPIRNSTQTFRITGGAAMATGLRGTNPNTRLQERVTVVTRQLHDDHLVYMLFVTPEKDASRYGNVMQAMINSLQIDEDRHH
ncbi:MAG TPA: M48 family metallopeptidase [Thermoanaerobaculia bacterium]|nr:M48 family metallopeptidase [Thermoanaerobaculia bacterium]